MTSHPTGTRAEWLAARIDLLAAEKALTRQSDELARRRRELPWVRIDEDYRFETDEGPAVHLAHHDVTLCAVSRAPLARLRAYKERMGWTFPWASSSGSDFNYDFYAAYTTEQQQSGAAEVNYGAVDMRPWLEVDPDSPWVARLASASGVDWPTYRREAPGMSAFALQDGAVYHTYSAYARGIDAVWGMYQWLDRAPLGRNEAGMWWRRHDEYENQ
jgi:predicted dithiol-disulfide oxidoreductase (DUF899 family)